MTIWPKTKAPLADKPANTALINSRTMELLKDILRLWFCCWVFLFLLAGALAPLWAPLVLILIWDVWTR